jgi:hypothetical protein
MAMYRTEDFEIGAVKGKRVRLSWSSGLFKARAVTPGGKPTYSGTLILHKVDNLDDLRKLAAMVKETVTAQWGDKGMDRFNKKLIKNPILDGAGRISKKSGDLHAGFSPDVFFIRPNSGADFPPLVIGPTGAVIDEKGAYSGCYVKAVLNAYAWNNPQQGDGVSFGLRMVQKLQEGERLGGGEFDANKWIERGVEDAGDAPAETTTGEGAGSLFA